MYTQLTVDQGEIGMRDRLHAEQRAGIEAGLATGRHREYWEGQLKQLKEAGND